jgi:hypothetical protein
MRKIVFMIIIAGVLSLTGCGNQPGADATAETSEAVQEETQVAELSDTIVLPEGWAISAAEVEAILGMTGYSYWNETLSNAAAGKPQGSYYDGQLSKSCINFLVYTFDGQSNFDRVSAFVNNSVDVPGNLWDRAIIGEMGGGIDDITVGMLILRGDVCIRIRWSPEIYPGFDRNELCVKLAEQLINNLYGGERVL